MANSSSVSMHFFKRFLTIRHLLTSRALTGMSVVALFLAVPLAYQWGTQASAGKPQPSADAASPTNAASNGEPSRLLRVVTSPIRSAGPDFLIQRYTGVVSARRTSQLAAKSVGRVEAVQGDLGDAVQVGQLLVQLDDEQLKASRAAAAAQLEEARVKLEELERGPREQDIEQAEARVAESQATLKLRQANFQRLTQLHDTSAVSQQEFDESRYELEAMEAQLESAKQALAQLYEGTRREHVERQKAVVAGLVAQLDRLDADWEDRRIVAPFSGYIQSREVDEGAVVAPGQSLVTLVEAAPYEVRVGLPPDVTAQLTESNLSVTRGDQQLTVKIDRMAPAIEQRTRTREVVLLLSDAASRVVQIGSAVNVSVRRPARSEGFWVPTTALTAGPRGLWAVFVAVPSSDAPTARGDASARPEEDDGEYIIERRQVELLRAQGDWSAIRGPLSPEDRLVTEGVHRISPGQGVRIVTTTSSMLAGAQPSLHDSPQNTSEPTYSSYKVPTNGPSRAETTDH